MTLRHVLWQVGSIRGYARQVIVDGDVDIGYGIRFLGTSSLLPRYKDCRIRLKTFQVDYVFYHMTALVAL